MPESETEVSMRLELEKNIKVDVDWMHNKGDKQMKHTGIIKREQIQVNVDLSQFKTSVEKIVNDHAKRLSENKGQIDSNRSTIAELVQKAKHQDKHMFNIESMLIHQQK